MTTKQRGFTLIELMIVIAIIAIIAAIAIPNLIEARKSGNESAAIGSLRTVSTAQAMFREADRGGVVGGLDYATDLTELGSSNLIDDVLAAGEKQGYCFILFSKTSSTWHSHAAPRLPGETGDRYFYIDESGVIRSAVDAQALPSSPALGNGGTPPSDSSDHRTGERPPCNRRSAGRTTTDALGSYVARTMNRLSKYAGSEMLDQALGSAKSKDVQRAVLSALDANHDGALTFEETLQTNVLGLARTLQGILTNPPHDKMLGKDRHLTAITRWFMQKVRNSLRLGAGKETKFPAVPIETMLGPANPPLPPTDNLPPTNQQ